MSDVLAGLGLLCLIFVGFSLSMIAGFVVVAAGFTVLALALSDGKGFTWRS